MILTELPEIPVAGISRGLAGDTVVVVRLAPAEFDDCDLDHTAHRPAMEFALAQETR
jgi:hypothetical protein